MTDTPRPPSPLPSCPPPSAVLDGLSAWERFLCRVAKLPPWLRQFVKFGIVGGSGTLVNLGIFSLIIFVYVEAAGTRPLIVEQIASGVAFCVAVVGNYYFNRRWTFRHRGPVIAHFGRFFLVSCVGLVLNVLFYTALHSWAGLGEHLSELLAIGCVMPMNFVGSKFWAFR
jgi:putative flippase GtrA